MEKSPEVIRAAVAALQTRVDAFNGMTFRSKLGTDLKAEAQALDHDICGYPKCRKVLASSMFYKCPDGTNRSRCKTCELLPKCHDAKIRDNETFWAMDEVKDYGKVEDVYGRYLIKELVPIVNAFLKCRGLKLELREWIEFRLVDMLARLVPIDANKPTVEMRRGKMVVHGKNKYLRIQIKASGYPDNGTQWHFKGVDEYTGLMMLFGGSTERGCTDEYVNWYADGGEVHVKANNRSHMNASIHTKILYMGDFTEIISNGFGGTTNATPIYPSTLEEVAKAIIAALDAAMGVPTDVATPLYPLVTIEQAFFQGPTHLQLVEITGYLAVQQAFAKRGWSVTQPVGFQSKTDWLFAKPNKQRNVQAKKYDPITGCANLSCRDKGLYHQPYRVNVDVDAFLIWFVLKDLDDVYELHYCWLTRKLLSKQGYLRDPDKLESGLTSISPPAPLVTGYRKDSVRVQCQRLLPVSEDGKGFRTPIRIKPRGWLTQARLDEVATKSERLRDMEFKEWWNRDIANRMAKEAVEAALTKGGEGRGQKNQKTNASQTANKRC